MIIDQRFRRVAVAIGAAVMVLIASLFVSLRSEEARVIVGKTPGPPTTPARTDPGPPEVDAPGLRPNPLLEANGIGYGPALPFRGAVNVPKDLKFFLVVGSDARPGQPVDLSRADSVHVVAVDPLVGEGTIIGLPRDSYVNVPGHGRGKINSALALGGPDLMVRTVRELTGFPISFYAITAFDGLVRMVDELKGLKVKVPYRMDDHFSGARFEPGWHRMDGRQVLAFSRARHGVPGGDFGRSENQGRVILHALEKLRAETESESGIRKWLGVLFKHAKLNMSMTDAVELGVLARQLVPSDFRNVVVQGTGQTAGGQSVVVLADSAYELFRDVGADAQADGDERRDRPKDPPPGATPTPEPTAKPKPKKTPAPTPVVDIPV